MAQTPNQPNLNQTRQDIMDIASMTEETFRSVAANIQDIFANALNASDTVIKSFQKDITNSIKSTAREASKIADNFERMNQGALKQADIQKQLEARAAKLRSIEVSINALKKVGTAEAISQAGELNKQYQDLVGINQSYTEELNKQIQILDEVDKEIGLLGGALGGVGTVMKALGLNSISKPITDAIETTKKYKTLQKFTQNEIILKQEEINKLNIKGLSIAQIRAGFGGKELKNLQEQKDQLIQQNQELDKKTNKYKNLLSSLKEQLTLTNMTDAILVKTVQSFFKLDEAQAKFTNLTGGQIPIMDQFNDRLITSVDYIKTAGALTEQLGMNAQAVFSPDTLAAAAEMVKAMGMTQEQANQAAIMSQATGVGIDDMNKSLKEGNKQYNQQNRSALAQGVIMREVYSTSTAIAASMGNSVDRIGDAVRRAKDLGLSLKDVEGIASSLLDIESSIAAEFEYEVISGKQLNLEAARYYALTNQTDKLTKEIANNQAVIQSFASGNRIEQEAAAKALGISRDQLAEMYMADLRKKELTDEQIAQAMAMDEMDVKKLSTQEAINTSIAKMTELLAGPAQVLTSMIDNAWILYSVMGLIGTVAIASIFNGLVKTTTQLAFNLALTGMLGKEKKKEAMATAVNTSLEAGGSAAKVPIVGPALAAVAILSIMGLAAGLMSKIGDGAFPASGKSMVSTREGGIYEPSKNDDIAVGPGIIDRLNSKSQPSIVSLSAPIQQAPQIDYDKMAEANARAISRVKVQTNLDGVRVSSELQKAPMGIATRKI
jgi:hypothetical protein